MTDLAAEEPAEDPNDGRHLRAVAPDELGTRTPETVIRYSIDAERYVLGAIMASSGKAFGDLGNLAAADFYRPGHEALFTLMNSMQADGDPVEIMSVFDRIAVRPVRGINPVDLHTMLSTCMTTANVGYYAHTVKQLARLRRLREAGARLIQLSEGTEVDKVDEVVENARQEVDLAGHDGSTGEVARLGDLMLDAIERWDSPQESALSTGLLDLDQMLSGGLRPGHFMVIGARPAVGKSVVASVFAQAAAAQQAGTLFASLEMSRGEVVDRIIANVGSVDLAKLTRRELGEDDWQRVSRAHRLVGDWPLMILDRASLSVAQLQGRARDVARSSNGLGLVVLDYLQLVRPGDPRAPRQEQVAAISRGLKLMAKELNVPVVALAQVNRGPMSRTDKRPMMSDLRESGGIEADADEIILLHRDDEESPGEIEFIVEKNRHGRTGKVAMAWSPHYSRVGSMYPTGVR